MPIGFGFSVPSVPGTYIEVLGPAGATGSTSHPVYALGMRTTAATIAADTWTPIPGDGSAASTYFGVGSQAAAVCKAIKAQYPGVDLYCAAQAEEGGGVAATGTITVTVATALSGTIYLRVAGVDLTVAVTAGDAQNTIGANILAALNALPDLPTTQACPANICTLTARHKGLYGNDIKIELNPLGAAGGQVTPGGVTVNIAAMSGGTTEPSITTAISNMVNLAPGVICSPYSECGGSSPGAALKTEMAGRWGALRMQWGHVCTARADTYGNLLTWGSSSPAINDPALSCLALYGSSTPSWIIAGAFAGATAQGQWDADNAKLAQGFTGIKLVGVRAPTSVANRFTVSERNALLAAGLAIVNHVGDDTYIQRARTTYRLNSGGSVDAAWYDQRTRAIVQRIIETDKSAFESAFTGAVLVEDSKNVGAGQKVCSPALARGWFAGRYAKYERDGIVTDADAFLAGLVIEIHDGDPNRLDVLYPPVISGWLAVSAWQVAPWLQAP